MIYNIIYYVTSILVIILHTCAKDNIYDHICKLYKLYIYIYMLNILCPLHYIYPGQLL